MAGWFSPIEAGSTGSAAMLALVSIKSKFPFKTLFLSFEESFRMQRLVPCPSGFYLLG
jgi:hypothetical protein